MSLSFNCSQLLVLPLDPRMKYLLVLVANIRFYCCLANWQDQIYHLQCLVLCSIHSGLSRSGRQCLMSKLIDVAWPSICFVSVLVSVPLVDMTAVSWVLAPRDWLSISSHSPLLQSPTNAYSHTYTAIAGYYVVVNIEIFSQIYFWIE